MPIALFRTVASMALAATVATALQAAPITTLYSTGVNNAGALLANGAVDSHYSVTPGSGPFVIGNPGSVGWIGNTAGSQWISSAANTLGGPGPFTYTTSFDLTGLDYTTAIIDAEISSDNMATVRLNGNVVGTQPFGGWTNMYALTISSGFLAGINTLTFQVPNNQTTSNDGPTGLQVHIISATVPEPSSLALAGLALMVAWRAARRRLV